MDNDIAKRLYEAAKELANTAVESVELGDWPELQQALDKTHTAIAEYEQTQFEEEQ